jgi:two-component system, chemotaxis family, chemotaxis protein CheY
MGYRILIVDDSNTMRKIIIRTIKMTDVPVEEIMEAENGEKGLEHLRSSTFNLVITDINMPVMDGIAMIDEIRSATIFQNIPIVVISTEGSETKIDRLSGKGVKAYIRKPFTPEMIRDILNEVLEVSHVAQ